MNNNLDERQPDLTLFYSKPAKEIVVLPNSDKEIIVMGRLYELCSDFEMKNLIGSVEYNSIDTIYKTNKVLSNTSQASFILPQGNIIFNSSNINEITDLGYFKEDKTFYFPIVGGGGSGNFTFCKGWVVINTLKDDNRRIVYIYFE
jgi:hypothetical protein